MIVVENVHKDRTAIDKDGMVSYEFLSIIYENATLEDLQQLTHLFSGRFFVVVVVD